MDHSELTKKICHLAQLDIDATHAYEEALEHIDEETIYKKISDFKNDHIHHTDNLSALIKKYGGTPPEKTKDFKGYVIVGFTSLRSITGTEGALNAMETNEKLTNKTYHDFLEENKNLPEDVKTVIVKNYQDEQRHLKYIQDTLESLENQAER